VSPEFIFGWIGVLSFFVGTGVSIYAICDVRKEIKKLIRLERNRVYASVLNDIAWVFLAPTERAQSKEISRSLEEFHLLAKALEPKTTPEIAIRFVNHEAVVRADKLVKGGYAIWSPGWDMEKVKAELHRWQTVKNEVALTSIFGKERKDKSLF